MAANNNYEYLPNGYVVENVSIENVLNALRGKGKDDVSVANTVDSQLSGLRWRAASPDNEKAR
ncbi:unnamed protein product [Acanthoscelides obtectus]|uniref:Uncharacterized protein n=1 Tax=Acanthoscelides obtectus TaxID=200917 RepID=A0A9P0PTY3_ACAOB|nr:unnamed protein product [Acanthoscelides obtectus]CAK1654452.1 hypothetical protein AOBTE_LOCUS18608 [Acanthoscelides obtectus]